MQTLTNTTNDIETNDSGGTTAPFNFANSGQVTNPNGETNVTTRAETNVNSSGENGGSRSGVSVPPAGAGGGGGAGGPPDGPGGGGGGGAGGPPDGPGGGAGGAGGGAGGPPGGPGGGAILPVPGPIRRRPCSIWSTVGLDLTDSAFARAYSEEKKYDKDKSPLYDLDRKKWENFRVHLEEKANRLCINALLMIAIPTVATAQYLMRAYSQIPEANIKAAAIAR